MNKEKLKIWGKRLLTAAALVILCVNLITLGLDLTGQRENTGWMPYQLHTVESGSMEPALSRGDLILVKQVPYETLEIGDDVTFITTDGFVTHRLVAAQGQQFVTRGLANDLEDLRLLGAESYCGKVVAAMPLLGWPLKALAEAPAAVAILCLMILMATVGQPLLKQRFDTDGEEKPRKSINYPRRGLLCAAAISMLVSMPTMTEAKYLTRLSRYELAVAQPMYFTSNYLSEGAGNTYSIQGWSGSNYTLNLDIKNSDNELLYNSADMTVEYGIGIEMLEGSDRYEISLTNSNSTQVSELTDFGGYPSGWEEFATKKAYSMPGGSPQTHYFSIVISPKGSNKANAKDVVKFVVHACTFDQKSYRQEIKGTFQLQVAESDSFLGQIDVKNSDSMVTLSVTTNLVTDTSTDGQKLVAFRWDPNLLYLNEYERTAYNAIKDGVFYRDQGLLYVYLQAYSKLELEFFKQDNFTAGHGHFAIQVVENTSTRPELSTPSTDTTDPSDPGTGEESES